MRDLIHRGAQQANVPRCGTCRKEMHDLGYSHPDSVVGFCSKSCLQHHIGKQSMSSERTQVPLPFQPSSIPPSRPEPTEPPGRKDDAGKPRWDLLPPKALFEVVLVLTFGANKYQPDGWRHVPGWRWRYFRALLGHVWSWWRGEKNDAESGLPNLAHAACCVMFLLELDA